MVLSGDPKIAYRPHEAIAFIDNGLLSFFPSEQWNDLKGFEQAAVLVHAWPRIAAAIKNEAPGTLWRIPCNKRKNGLHLIDAAFEQLRIPDNVLEDARKQRHST